MAKRKKRRGDTKEWKGGPIPMQMRVGIVQAVKRGVRHADVAVGYGVSLAVVQKFIALFDAGGMTALAPKLSGVAATQAAKKRAKSAAGSAERKEAVELREQHPDWGTRRIRDVMARFSGLGVSETTVRRILHEEGLIEEHETPSPRDKPERRFERAEPNQLWQSDIFTFELRRHQRLYLTAFMDDHSRFLVSWALAHHQKSTLVIEAFERGVAEYGTPREVLTDQGRQYAAWRGETDFQVLLRRHGIAHSKSRPQHPQTLGKIERFWKTLWEEFLGRTVFADFADCLRRLELFVQHYNFQRPHQGLEGLVPADRFFRAAPHVRAAVETQIKANALRLAQEKPAQKPFYLVGRLGDQDLSIAAAGGALRVQVGDAAQTIPMNKEQDDETKASRAFVSDETDAAPTMSPRGSAQEDRTAALALAAARGAQPLQASSLPTSTLIEEEFDETEAKYDIIDTDEVGSSPAAAAPWRAAVADRSQGSGPGGTASVPARALGPLRADVGDGGDHRAWDLASALLPARDQGGAGDAEGAGTWSGLGILARGRQSDAADRLARGQGHEARAGETTAGTTPAADQEGAAGGADRISSEAWASARPQVGVRWRRTLVGAEEGDDGLAHPVFDPDDGWRDDAVTWHRKLAGEHAPTDGERDGETTWGERAVDVSGPIDGGTGTSAALRSDPCGDRGAGLDQRGSARAGDRASEHADGGASSGGSDRVNADAAIDWATAEAPEGEGARSGAEAPGEAEREAGGAAAGSGRHAGSGGGDHPEPARSAAEEIHDLFASIAALGENEELGQRRGPRTSDDLPDARRRAADDKG